MTRIALVTGGTRGIGAAICRALQDAGLTVAANHLGGREEADAFTKATGIANFNFDVADFDACQAGIEAVAADLGPIDVLVNNAGITRDAMLHKMDAAQWRAVIDVNLNAAFNTARCVIEGMRARGFGRIVNIASVNGLKGQLGQANYAAAKAGLIGFTKALALESAAKGVTVNAVAPGYVATDMVKAIPEDVLNERILPTIPVGRLAEPEEIARCVAFLASDEAGFITGATLSVNGGQYMA